MSVEDVAGAVAGGGAFEPSDDAEGTDAICAQYLRNDDGNGQRLLARFGHDILYVGAQGWHVWDGRRWRLDSDGLAVRRVAFETARALRGEAEALDRKYDQDVADGRMKRERADELVAKAHKWALECGNMKRINPMIAAAQPAVETHVDEMDAAPWAVTAENGTLLLRPPGQGDDDTDPVRLVKPDRAHRLTKMLGCAYQPGAECPVFEAFLARVQPDEAVRRFLQRLFGYALTGDTSGQMLVMLLGAGANGKSTLTNLMSQVFGELGLVLPAKTLLHDDRAGGGQASPDLAMLPGVRLAMASEPDTGARLSESTIKILTGGEKMAARQLRERFFHFKPQAKLVFSFNNRPSIRGQDDGIWRRIALVRWDVKIPAGERDPAYVTGAAFAAELPGVLNWLLDGFRMWREEGLNPPPQVMEATRAYRLEEDRLGAFLGACTREDEAARCQAKELFEVYQRWCRENAVEAVSGNLFGRLMTERGYERQKISVYFYKGLEIVDRMEGATAGQPPDDGAPPAEGPEDYGR